LTRETREMSEFKRDESHGDERDERVQETRERWRREIGDIRVHEFEFSGRGERSSE
jgi:hypothetical protein